MATWAETDPRVRQQYGREITKISESALENADKLYKRAKITTDVGTTPQTILAEAEAALAREKQNVKTAEINTNRSLFALAMLLQLSDYKDFDIQEVPLKIYSMRHFFPLKISSAKPTKISLK